MIRGSNFTFEIVAILRKQILRSELPFCIARKGESFAKPNSRCALNSAARVAINRVGPSRPRYAPPVSFQIPITNRTYSVWERSAPTSGCQDSGVREHKYQAGTSEASVIAQQKNCQIGHIGNPEHPHLPQCTAQKRPAKNETDRTKNFASGPRYGYRVCLYKSSPRRRNRTTRAVRSPPPSSRTRASPRGEPHAPRQ